MVGINVPIPVPVAYYSFGGWKGSLFGDLHMYGPEGVQFYTRGQGRHVPLARPGHQLGRPGLPAHALIRAGHARAALSRAGSSAAPLGQRDRVGAHGVGADACQHRSTRPTGGPAPAVLARPASRTTRPAARPGRSRADASGAGHPGPPTADRPWRIARDRCLGVPGRQGRMFARTVAARIAPTCVPVADGQQGTDGRRQAVDRTQAGVGEADARQERGIGHVCPCGDGVVPSGSECHASRPCAPPGDHPARAHRSGHWRRVEVNASSSWVSASRPLAAMSTAGAGQQVGVDDGIRRDELVIAERPLEAVLAPHRDDGVPGRLAARARPLSARPRTASKVRDTGRHGPHLRDDP